MELYGGLPGLEEDIVKCMKCGSCQAVCPLYRETAAEPAVARAKVQLAQALLNGVLEPSEELAGHFDFCLTCWACVDSCPSGVRADRIIMAARQLMAQRLGLSLIKKAAAGGFSRPALMNAGLSAARACQGLLFNRRGQSMQPRFPMGIEMRRKLPALAPSFLRDSLPERVIAKQPRFRVAFFTGCMLNYVYPDAGRDIVGVLKEKNIEVLIPRAQHCCGAPVVIAGDQETAASMACSQVELFSSLHCDAIITACGTCGESFKDFYPSLLAGGALEAKARELGDKTFDICQFIMDKGIIDGDRLMPLEETVTYHQPCHLGRGMGVLRQPLELLKIIPGIDFKALGDPGRCCGGAGFFSLTNYQFATRVRRHKIIDIEGTAASIVATGCGSCRMHLEDGLGQAGIKIKVRHPVELLARALKIAYEPGGIQ